MATSPLLKLEIEMVPLSSWGTSLRNALPRSRWDKLRKNIHEKNGQACEICGSKEKVNCHEHWEFDEASKVQKLVNLGTVCSMCHHVAHIGRSKQLAAQGYLDLSAVVDHFLKVNCCDMKTFKAHEKYALATFTRRSNVEWQIDFGEYAELVREHAR
jgi:hypothetical protein